VLFRSQREVEQLRQKQDKPVAPAAAPAAPNGMASVLAKTEVEVYGTLVPFVDHAETTGATATAPAGRPTQVAAGAYTGANQPGRERITVGTSNIGFRGSLSISETMKAIWQIEAGVQPDGDAGPNTFGSRNTNIGVAGAWGTAFVGNWDTPYKWMTLAAAPLKGLTPADYGNLLSNPGFGVSVTTTQSGRVNGVADAAFDRRQGNSLQYWSPNFYGLSARLAYSLGENRSASTAAASTSPTLFSGSLAYENGALKLRYAYEQHNDYFGLSQIGGGAGATATNASSKDWGHKLLASYALGSTKLTGIYERLGYENSDSAVGNVNRYERDAYYLTLEQKIALGKAWVSYGKAGDGNCERVGGASCVTSGLHARQAVLGFSWPMNKYLDVFAMVYEIKTGESSRYGSFPAPNNATAPGADTRGGGIGSVLSF